MKPNDILSKLTAVVVILLCVELLANFVMSSEAKSKYLDGVQAEVEQAK